MLFVHVKSGTLSVLVRGAVSFASFGKDVVVPVHNFCLKSYAPGTKLTARIDGECEFSTVGKDNVVDFSLVLKDGDFVLNDLGNIQNAKRVRSAKRKR